MSSATSRLSTYVKVRQHHLRSAHLEHHEGQVIESYVPTGRVLEVLHRVGRAMTSSDTGRAWSLTGPYGAGKSSFALFVHALLGPDGNEARSKAEATLRATDPELLALIAAGRELFRRHQPRVHPRVGYRPARADQRRQSLAPSAPAPAVTGAHAYQGMSTMRW